MRHAIIDNFGKIQSFVDASIKGVKDGKPVVVDVDPPSPPPGMFIVPAPFEVSGDHIYKDGAWILPQEDNRGKHIAKLWKNIDAIVRKGMDQNVRDRLLLIMADPDSKPADRAAVRQAFAWSDSVWDIYEETKEQILSGNYDPNMSLDIPELGVDPISLIKSARKG